ncbi:MAG: glycine--tRNA ligase [Bacilli bacterium]|nr:glycine--tRNA ligase [Bacilli bacterium]
MNNQKQMEELVNFCKQYGYIFQGSEIYGGLSNTFDYGPLGASLKENVRQAWWKKFIQENPYNYGMNSAILMNPKTWEATGHVANFSDPLMDCKHCKNRFRADKIVDAYLSEKDIDESSDGWSKEKLESFIKEAEIPCPKCGKSDFTEIREFNTMFKTFQGVTEDAKAVVYLRPETAQGIFVNFLNVQRSMRLKLPFGIGQTGKAFRNEITPGNFTFRTREFEQMELEFFCKPGEDLEWFGYYKSYCMDFLLSLGLSKENLRFHDHKKEELVFYSVATTDIQYRYYHGFDELWGIADRTDYDLTVHQDYSGSDLRYLDPETNEKYIPYVIEPSVGLDRLVLAILTEAYQKEMVEGEERVVLKLHPYLAPVKVTILPLVKKVHGDKAKELYATLAKDFQVSYDEAGSIGKRYRRSDAVGTPFCITVDDATLVDNTVTVRDRDTMEQITLSISELANYIQEQIQF